MPLFKKTKNRIKEIRYSVEKKVLIISDTKGNQKGYTGKFAEQAIQRYIYQNELNVKPKKIKKYGTKH